MITLSCHLVGYVCMSPTLWQIHVMDIVFQFESKLSMKPLLDTIHHFHRDAFWHAIDISFVVLTGMTTLSQEICKGSEVGSSNTLWYHPMHCNKWCSSTLDLNIIHAIVRKFRPRGTAFGNYWGEMVKSCIWSRVGTTLRYWKNVQLDLC